MTEAFLARIADALERLAPPQQPDVAADSGAAFFWNGTALARVEPFQPVAFELLQGIDAQKEALLTNTARFAAGHAAQDVLLWGARGMGKSASVKAAVAKVQGTGANVALVQIAADRLDTLGILFDRLRGVPRRFVLFIDDLGLDAEGSEVRTLRSLLEGGASGRPGNVRLYVTSNRRHIVPRTMREQDDPINPRDAVDDHMALQDRFGLSLGYHNASQDAYLAIVSAYAAKYGLSFDPAEAVQWATQRGHRSGRTAWHYVVELAGRAGRDL